MNPEGQKRQFLFVKGKAVASDQPEKLSVQRRGDVSVLLLGENFERYEIVDALVVGGVRPQPVVRDGNTIVVTPYGDPFTVRLACLRPPQLRQGSSGLAAKAALEGLLQPGAWVTLSTRSKATEGTELAEIIPVGSTVPINLSLVQVALAALDHQAASPCNQQIYREAELRAQAMQLGLWRPSPGTR